MSIGKLRDSYLNKFYEIREEWFLWGAVVFAAAAITMFVAPTKEFKGLAFLLISLIMVFSSTVYFKRFKLEKSWEGAWKPILPILAIPIIGMLHLINGANTQEYIYFISQFTLGLFCYLAFFQITRSINNNIGERAIVVMLLLPGLVHLGIFAVDLIYKFGGMSFSVITAHAEEIKDVSRVGRKYFSVGLSLFLVIDIFASARASGKLKIVLLAMLFPASVTLAVLDTRSALLSMLFVFVMIFIVPTFRKAAVRTFLEISARKYLLLSYLIVILSISAFISYEAGKTRGSFLLNSLTLGLQTDTPSTLGSTTKKTTTTASTTTLITPATAWLSKSYWDSDCEGPMGRFRCTTDSSAYLRSSWLVFGIKGLWQHPLGIGFDREPLRHLYVHDHPNDDISDLALADSHSQLLDEAISFGLIGIVFYAIFFLNLIRMGYEKIRANTSSPIYFGLYLVMVVCMARFALDNFKEGLGYYLMSIVGMFVALTLQNKNSNQPEV